MNFKPRMNILTSSFYTCCKPKLLCTCTGILIRLSVYDYDAITRAYIMYIGNNIYYTRRGMVGGAGGVGDGLPMVSRVSL